MRSLTRTSRRRIAIFATLVVLTAGSILYLGPLGWMISTALKTPDQIYDLPIRWIPDPVDWGNFVELFTEVPFAQYIGNTVVLTALGVLGSITGSSLAAYGFARFRFRGRNALFVVMLSTMMIPVWVTIVPSYVFFGEIGWLDTYLPILVPAFFATPFNTFLLRQFFLSIPQELDEAARIDGAGSVRIFFQIILPLSVPALMMVGLFSFLFFWNDYLGPLIYLQSQELYPLSLGVANFVGTYNQNYPLMMMAAMVSMLPCIALFAIAQKWFMQGIVISGVKG
ncbi:carbohydrate ABC transporter permease [Salinibacterium soli]|uniref:Carbohydrate ABC transporter permease n=1 Tax=Antiquaquibacter soli TaxID=3064523 RepID=A0ABT9BP13_9MICO|nr:carbohydrate ABC transporter permease [Protaetiibacter sp. WY-16]MDO7882704.1 carbohydrate ABC transporter permease [Protaetiibacter sp. WY-16]